MRTCARICAVFLCALLALWAAKPRAEWIEDGMPICTEQYAQEYMEIIPDGFGGAIMVWADYRTPTPPYLYHDIYAQRVDKRGNELWASGGIPISTDTLDQSLPQIVPDGYGNFIICWVDTRNATYGDIYAQRIDIDGNALWTSGGIPISPGAYNQNYPRMIPVEGGGAIIAWLDWRSGSNYDVYAQRIDTSGTELWTAGGVGACTNMYNQDDLEICPNGAKGVYLAWEDMRNLNYDIYMNMIDSSGALWCTSEGYPVTTNGSNQFDPIVLYDGEEGQGDMFITWVDQRNGNNDIYAERMSGCYTSWSADGIPICTATDVQSYQVMAKYGNYGFIVAWRDSRGGTDVDLYAQRVDFFGNVYWGANGKLIASGIRDQWVNDVVETSDGNIIFIWADTHDIYDDLYVQKTDPDGDPLWDADGMPLCTAYYVQNLAGLVADEEGGAIMAWLDQRNWQTLNKDIYAQRIDGSGVWGYPSPAISQIEDVPNDQGGSVTVGFDPSPLDRLPYTEISHYSVWRNMEAPAATALFESGVKSTPLSAISADFEGTAYRFLVTSEGIEGWEWLGNMDAHRLESYTYTAATLFDSTGADDGVHHFFVASHTLDPFVYWDSEPDSGYSVDNLAPCAPVAVTAEQQFDPEGLLIHWNPNTEADLSGYRVYRGTEEGFTPDPEINLLTTTCDTTVTDGDWRWDNRYYYKIVAIDTHGNESDAVLVTPDGVTGEETPDTPTASYLSQNFPNPFNPVTRIDFGLKTQGAVSLRIYDVAGRLVRVLVDEERDAGHYTEEWNGRDNGGRTVASGIYFYAIEAGDFRQTRKMVLLR